MVKQEGTVLNVMIKFEVFRVFYTSSILFKNIYLFVGHLECKLFQSTSLGVENIWKSEAWEVVVVWWKT